MPAASPGVVGRGAILTSMKVPGSRLIWAKFWLVATGVWWGVCMQLLFYQGVGHPLAMVCACTCLLPSHV